MNITDLERINLTFNCVEKKFSICEQQIMFFADNGFEDNTDDIGCGMYGMASCLFPLYEHVSSFYFACHKPKLNSMSYSMGSFCLEIKRWR